MENFALHISSPSIGPVQQTPAARPAGGVSAPSGVSFSEELTKALQESGPAESESVRQVLATDQRLNELRSDLSDVRRRVQQLQAFQAQAVELYRQISSET